MIPPDFNLITFLTACLITTPIFFIGLNLQMKIVKTVKLERGMTWEITLCHSVIMVLHYTCTFSFEVFANILPSISEYTGEWFCYVMIFVRGYGLFSIALHSLMIGLYKYLFIVQNTMVRVLGEERIKRAMLAIYLINPVFTTLSFMARSPYLLPAPTFTRCSVHERMHSFGDVMEKEGWKRTFFCGLDDNNYEGSNYVMYIITQCYCFCQTLVFFASMFNLLEAFIYYKIFKLIKRLVLVIEYLFKWLN